MLQRTGHRKGWKAHEKKDYIDRGIDICQEWLNFDNFERWAYANGFDSSLQLDRIDNNKGYYPENCRWTTRSVNQRNKSNTVMVNWNGKVVPLADVYDSVNCSIPYKLFLQRVHRDKWDINKALTVPVCHTI